MGDSFAPISLVTVLEANPVQLEELALLHANNHSAEATYVRIRRAFMADDRETLKNIVETVANKGDELANVFALGSLRLAIRRGTVEHAELENFVFRLVKNPILDLWKAESTHIVAVAYECLNQDLDAKSYYLQAYQMFSELGSKLRAAVSYQNYVATESRINPHRRLLIEYDRAFQLAIAAGDNATAGTALNNLAREFQLMGALHAALKRSNEAVSLLKGTHFGSYQYFTSLANRCDILVDLGLSTAACNDYDELCCSDLAEIRGAVKVLHDRAAAHGWNWRQLETTGRVVLLPTWKERAEAVSSHQEDQRPVGFTNMETTLIEALSKKPKSISDLVEFIYGTNGDFLTKENRVKQLLHRLKKKAPHLILRISGGYVIAD